MSEAMAPLAADDPRMIAWNAYKQTEEYTNTRKWAQCEEHVDGSLWAAFIAGFSASPRIHAASVEATLAHKLRAAKAEAERNALAAQVAALRGDLICQRRLIRCSDRVQYCDCRNCQRYADTAAAADEYTKRIQAEAVAEMQDRLVETQINATGWMKRHDALLGLVQQSGLIGTLALDALPPSPSPADKSKLEHERDTERAARQAAEGRIADTTNELRAVEANSRAYAQRIAQLEAALRRADLCRYCAGRGAQKTGNDTDAQCMACCGDGLGKIAREALATSQLDRFESQLVPHPQQAEIEAAVEALANAPDATKQVLDELLSDAQNLGLYDEPANAPDATPGRDEGVTLHVIEQSEDFLRDLASVINRHSKENESDTPDFILAAFMAQALVAFGIASREREKWYARALIENAQTATLKAERDAAVAAGRALELARDAALSRNAEAEKFVKELLHWTKRFQQEVQASCVVDAVILNADAFLANSNQPKPVEDAELTALREIRDRAEKFVRLSNGGRMPNLDSRAARAELAAALTEHAKVGKLDNLRAERGKGE